MHVLQVWYYIKAFLPRFIDDEDEDLVESFKNNDFVLTGQVVCDICDSWLCVVTMWHWYWNGGMLLKASTVFTYTWYQSQVSTEDGVLVFAEGEVASAFSRMLLGDGEAELLGEIVTKEEERVVAEVVPKNTKLKETPKYKITGG